MHRFFAFLLMSAAEPIERRQNLDDLLSCIAQDDRAALVALYQRTSTHLFGVIMRIHEGDQAMAEEVLQDVYVQVWHTAGRYDPRHDQPLTWLMSIARRHAIELRRLRHPPVWSDPSKNASGMASRLSNSAPPEDVCVSMLARAHRPSLDLLTPLELQSFGLAYYLGMSCTEVAVQLRQPLARIKASLRRALPTLRQSVAPHPTDTTVSRT